MLTLSLFNYEGLPARLGAFARMGLSRPAMSRLDGARFTKLLGTGSGAGFSTRPNFGVYAVLTEWQNPSAAQAGVRSSPIHGPWRAKARQSVTFFLETVSSRGTWDGHSFPVTGHVQSLPVVALTRASIKPSKLRRFWSAVPAVSDQAENDSARRFMIGAGEIPWLHQVTFSLWDTTDAMETFARRSPTHGPAMRDAYKEGWFSEYCFLRFNLVAVEGRWDGLPESLVTSVRYEKAEALSQSAARLQLGPAHTALDGVGKP